MLKRIDGILVFAVVFSCAHVVLAQPHYSLGSDWVTGEGVYIVTDEKDPFEATILGNRVLVAAALNNNDPKHAWVNQDFGNNYTVRCDVRMETWAEGEDLARAGIAARIQPVGSSPDHPNEDVGINLLLHETQDNVQFLNDLRGWGPNEGYLWELNTWYTFE